MSFWAKLPCPTHILITDNVKIYQKNTMYRQHFHIIGTVIYYTFTLQRVFFRSCLGFPKQWSFVSVR